MTTRTPTDRAIEVPDLVSVKADQAIQKLRELGLMPITWCAEVEDVNEAGLVLGLDPPAGSPVRPKAFITLSVAAHPEFQGHADEFLAAQAGKVVELPLIGPEICDSFAISPAECRDGVTQLQLQLELEEHGPPARQSS